MSKHRTTVTVSIIVILVFGGPSLAQDIELKQPKQHGDSTPSSVLQTIDSPAIEQQPSTKASTCPQAFMVTRVELRNVEKSRLAAVRTTTPIECV